MTYVIIFLRQWSLKLRLTAGAPSFKDRRRSHVLSWDLQRLDQQERKLAQLVLLRLIKVTKMDGLRRKPSFSKTFFLPAESVRLYLHTWVSPPTPTDGMVGIFSLTSMPWPGFEITSGQLHLLEGPWLRMLYQLSYHGQGLFWTLAAALLVEARAAFSLLLLSTICVFFRSSPLFGHMEYNSPPTVSILAPSKVGNLCKLVMDTTRTSHPIEKAHWNTFCQQDCIELFVV